MQVHAVAPPTIEFHDARISSDAAIEDWVKETWSWHPARRRASASVSADCRLIRVKTSLFLNVGVPS
jgi:hypothetical protein